MAQLVDTDARVVQPPGSEKPAAQCRAPTGVPGPGDAPGATDEGRVLTLRCGAWPACGSARVTRVEPGERLSAGFVEVELWHHYQLFIEANFRKEPPPVVERVNYRLVARLWARSDNALETVYACTQSIEEGWHPTQQVRSTSVGDVVRLMAEGETEREAFMVMSMGFGALERF